MHLAWPALAVLDRSSPVGCTGFAHRAARSGDMTLLFSQELVGWVRNARAADELRG
jgi:hypothetical protein